MGLRLAVGLVTAPEKRHRRAAVSPVFDGLHDESLGGEMKHALRTACGGAVMKVSPLDAPRVENDVGSTRRARVARPARGVFGRDEASGGIVRKRDAKAFACGHDLGP